MIDKVIPANSQDNLVAAVGTMIQVFESSRHIKSAASPLYSRSDLEAFAPPKTHFLSHMVTMGSYEQYGENRNKDAWGHEQLLNKHATFETHARNYREHRNSDPRLAIGVIKSARYCPDLQRGELLMWTEIKKAPEEFEKARRGDEQSGSMAARVKEDVCGVCGFVSRKPSQRCDCIRRNAGRYYPEKQAYAVMHNIDPTFRDYSWVRRPADRIAHYLNYLLPEHSKAASEDRVLRGDELAMMYGLYSDAEIDSLHRIHEAGRIDSDNQYKVAFVKNVAPFAITAHLDDVTLTKMAAADPGKVMRELVDRGMVLPLADFNSWITGKSLRTSLIDPVVKEASAKMANIRGIIIRRISAEPDARNAFLSAIQELTPALPGCGCSHGDAIRTFFDKVRDQFSTRYEVLSKNASTAIMDGFTPEIVDVSAPSPEAIALGALYTAYLSKTACYLPDQFETHSVLAAMR